MNNGRWMTSACLAAMVLLAVVSCAKKETPSSPSSAPPAATDTWTSTPTLSGSETATYTPTITNTPTTTATFTVTRTSTPAVSSTATPFPTPQIVATFQGSTGGAVRGIAIYGSTLYAMDSSSNRLRAFNLSGTPVPAWTPIAVNGEAVATDPSGNILVSDQAARSVTKYNPSATPIATMVFTVAPSGLATDSSGNIYVTSAASNRVYKNDPTGAPVTEWALANSPWGVATAGTTLFIATIANSRVHAYDLSCNPITNWPTVNYGLALAVNSQPRLIVTGDITPGCRYTLNGGYEVEWGSYNSVGVAVDGSNYIYIGNYNTGVITKYAP
jgi:hypothetical protein